MQVENYLKKYQPVIYQTFLNALKKDQLSHAYLISGNNGAPLIDVATFFAKSILCDDPSPMACNSCITCLRVDDGNYPDFFIFDGSKATIKKDDVDAIETAFEKKAFENKGIRVYVLHLIENMTVQAINSILKFLEEPGQKVYAFLTTNNENSILPTIISRCQVLRLRLIDKQIVIQDAVDNGVDRKDAELLSYFYNDGELIKEILDDKASNAAFFSAKECFEDMINIKNQKEAFLESYATILDNLANKLSHLDESLIELLKCSGVVNTNVNIALLIDHIFNIITKEE